MLSVHPCVSRCLGVKKSDISFALMNEFEFYFPGDMLKNPKRQKGCHDADDISKFILLNENCCVLIKMPL